MVVAPSLPSTRPPCGGLVRDLLAHSPAASIPQRSSCSASHCSAQFGKSPFRSLAPGHFGCRLLHDPGAVRMDSTAAEQPSLPSKDGEAENGTKTVNVVIKGKVQGVYYRNWTVDSAQQLGVNGWVRNLKDGSVEAVFAGKSTDVDSLIQKCHQGPLAARVTSVEVSPWNDEVPQGFERKPTIW